MFLQIQIFEKPQTRKISKQIDTPHKQCYGKILELRTLRESSSKGFSDTIYNDMNTANTKLLKS